MKISHNTIVTLDYTVTTKIPLTAAQAFGEYNDELLVLESLDNLPDNLSVGTQIEGSMDGDEDDIVLYTVTEIRDGNHPLARLNLVFEGTVTEVHPATDEEIKALLHHGHGDDCGCGDH